MFELVKKWLASRAIQGILAIVLAQVAARYAIPLDDATTQHILASVGDLVSVAGALWAARGRALASGPLPLTPTQARSAVPPGP